MSHVFKVINIKYSSHTIFFNLLLFVSLWVWSKNDWPTSHSFVEDKRFSDQKYISVMAEEVTYSLSNVDHKGYLIKQSKWLKKWRRRHFVLKKNMLFICKGEGVAPHDQIDLRACNTIKTVNNLANRRNCFVVSASGEQYHMCADTDKEKDEWIGAIGRAIVTYSGNQSHEVQDDNEEEEDSSDDDEEY